MASDELAPKTPFDVIGRDVRESRVPQIESASELVALSEMLHRGVFGAGLIVSSIVTAYACVLSLLQPSGAQAAGFVAGVILLVGQLLAWYWRVPTYNALRRWPLLIAVPALSICVGAIVAGTHNQQFFYVLTVLLGICGIAVSLRATIAASIVAAIGVAAPGVAAGGGPIGVAISAALLPPIFWLLVQHLARFMLHLHMFMASEYELWLRTQSDGKPPGRVYASAENPGAPRPVAEPKQLPQKALSLHDWNTHRPRWRQLVGRTGVKLTVRQEQTLFYCCDGLDDSGIAEQMGIGVQQVRRNLTNACRRTGSLTRAQLVAWAVRLDLVP